MLTFLLGFILLSLVIAGMAIGVIMGRRPITGSCGGIGAALGEKDYTCDICGDDPAKCEEVSAGDSKTMNLSYDATKKAK
ncbi:(Na+)-NQR maturation NqrM [Eionea flava]